MRGTAVAKPTVHKKHRFYIGATATFVAGGGARADETPVNPVWAEFLTTALLFHPGVGETFDAGPLGDGFRGGGGGCCCCWGYLGVMDGLLVLEKVFKEEFTQAKSQRCQVHLAHDVLSRVPKKA